jgi:hypothetical protein
LKTTKKFTRNNPSDMKKIFLSLSLISTVIVASAQHARLNLYGSYVLDDGFSFYNSSTDYYNGKLKAGAQWGAGIEYQADPSVGGELMYFYKKSEAPSNFKFGTLAAEKTETFDVTQHYIMFGFNSHRMSASKKAEGYAGLLLGMVITDVTAPSTGNSSSNSNFAWGAKLGSDIWMSDKVGIKLQAQVLSSTRSYGGDLYYGYWGPVAVPDYTTVWQFGLGGGLTFRLGK